MFYANIAILFFVFLFLLLASFSDIKTRTISNRLILFFLIFGVSFNVLMAIYLNNYSPLLSLLFSAIIGFVVFFILWELGVIAGGDAKLFMAISMMLPTMQNTFQIFNIGQEKIFTFPIFTILLFVVSVFMVLPWILLYSKYLLFKRKNYLHLLKEIFSKKNLISIMDSVLVVVLLGLIMSILSLTSIRYILIISFVFTYLIFKIKIKKHFYTFIISLYLVVFFMFLLTSRKINYLLLSNTLNTIVFVFIFSVLIIYYRYIKEKVFVETKTISQLTEGDVPIYNYYYIKRKLIIKESNFFRKLKELAQGTYYKGLKVDSSKACGISVKDIAFLKDMYKNKLINNKIYVKKTIAFTPAVLLAFILLIIF